MVDYHSFADPKKARITSLFWKARVDFGKRVITGSATYRFSYEPGATEIIFDINGLTIHSVSDQNGSDLSYSIGETQPIMGKALTIAFTTATTALVIEYATSPQAEALLWLSPEQTDGGTMPFLFTQSEAILARSWIPIQDSPGIRLTYQAEVTVPAGMMALMSASNPGDINKSGTYHFEMNQPIPAYLMALAVGDLVYAQEGPRTGVYAEPAIIEAATYEFEEMEAMVEAAERLYGPYGWDQYDLLILPPSFPFGGMENPRLTFATPTILAGDRSLTSLVAHELAHSWSGNLVTNGTWEDFWINEGFTVYFEHRIMEEVYGRNYSEMLATLTLQDLKNEVNRLTDEGKTEDTQLKLNLKGRDPDDGMTNIAYDKGYFFLRLLEEKVGRETFDSFLRNYFSDHKFQSMTTEKFVEYLNHQLFEKHQIPVDHGLYQQWIYGPGLPANHPKPVSDRFERVDEAIKAWTGGESMEVLVDRKIVRKEEWSTHEWLHFIRHLPENMTLDQMKSIDEALHFTKTGNSEVLAAWFVHVIRHRFQESYERLRRFLIRTGRRKFLMPLYGELIKTTEGRIMAKEIYQEARPNYHFVATSSLDEMLNWSVNGK